MAVQKSHRSKSKTTFRKKLKTLKTNFSKNTKNVHIKKTITNNFFKLI